MIRIAKYHDLPAIIRIYNQAILAKNATADLSPKCAEEQIPWFEMHEPTKYPLYVYEDQGQLLGWCSISPYRQGREAVKEVGEISYYVEYSHHGQGIGSALVAHALEDCGRIGKRVLFAIIIEGNVRSIQLLQKYGFEQWGYLPNVVNIDGTLKGHVYLGKELNTSVSEGEQRGNASLK